MSLNDFEQHNSPYFAFFPPNSIALQGDMSQWFKIDL